MPAVNSVSGLVTVVRAFEFGGQSGKKCKRKVLTFTDGTNGIAVGGTTNTLLASDLGFTKIESCSHLLIFTTATGASARIYPAVPSYDGTMINTATPLESTDANRADVADVAIATTETGLITVDGY